jgi:23S rRNA (uracil1939-C5)-methyltransferase
MVNIVTFDRTPDKLKPLAAQLVEQVPGIRSVINTINSKKAQIAVGEEEILLAGKDHIQDRIGSFQFNISAGSFFQTNTAQAARLYEVVMDYAGLSGEEIVWDLYAGTGTISLFLAQKARFVYAFELVESAVADGKKNARENNLSNVEFISGDLLYNLEHNQVPADVIVTDPPRSGMHSKVCGFLAGCAARRLIYVSCNPATMARDLEILQTGYQVVRVQPVDMFPHTYHIESVALLEKKL